VKLPEKIKIFRNVHRKSKFVNPVPRPPDFNSNRIDAAAQPVHQVSGVMG